ncbi:MAG: ArsR family transcriptional regulator [Promethearchaeota archaeon]
MAKEPILKVCVFGETGVGKKTLINQCFEEIHDDLLRVPTRLTIGVDFFKGKLDIDGTNVTIQIWNFTGANIEKFRPEILGKGKKKGSSIFKNYVLGAKGAIFLYDITDKKSLNHLDLWLKIFRKPKDNKIVPILMLGNKADLKEKRKVPIDHANKLASKKNLIGAIEITAKNQEVVKTQFVNFSRIMLDVDSKRKVVDIFKSDLDLRILTLLHIYKELNLTNLTYHLGKNKATLSRHTRDLIKLGLIESYSKEGEIHAGNIKRKYYRLSENFKALLKNKQINTEIAIQENNWKPLFENLPRFSYVYKQIRMISEHLNNYIEVTENLLLTSVAMEGLPMIEIINLLIEVLENNLIEYRFISESQYEKIKDLSLEFHAKLDEFLKNDDSLEKPYLYMDILLNVLGLTKYGTKTSLYLLGLRQGVQNSLAELNKNK